MSLNRPFSLFYIPGTLIGAFIVDYLTPKYSLVRIFACPSPFGPKR